MGLPVIVLTSAGAALLAKTPIGASIPVTGWKIGTGALPVGTNLQNQTELVSPLAEATIASVEPNENQCLITGQFVNTGMAAFDWEETGLFASDPDNGTILFAYGNSFGSGEAIPAGSSQLREIVFGAQLVFDVAPNITAVINQGLVFATLTQLNQRIPNSEKGEPNGVATLGADGKLVEGQRPDYTGKDIRVSTDDETNVSDALSAKANAVPPQEHDLLLSENFVVSSFADSRCLYAKNEFREVTVNIRAKYIGEAASDLKYNFATIPMGYHPGYATEFPVVINDNAGNLEIGLISIVETGEVFLHFYKELINGSEISGSGIYSSQ